jgi:uncharacterized protein YfaS (alpha-2-macroglobulin family)
VIGYKRANF